MLCVLKTTISRIWVFKHTKHVFEMIKHNRNFTLKLLYWPNLRALSYASLLILTHKLHCTSEGEVLKWPVLKQTIQVTVVSEP